MTFPVSKRLQLAAAAELKRVNAAITKVDARVDALIAQLQTAQAERAHLGGQHADLIRLAGDMLEQERVALVGDGRTLTGPAIRETAVRLLVALHGTGYAVHYRDWFRLLCNEGYAVRGKDPLATFLTNITRCPVVRRSTSPGIYEVDDSAVTRLRAQLDQRQVELRDLAAAIAASGIPSRDQSNRRSFLSREARRLETALDEAARVLESLPAETPDA